MITMTILIKESEDLSEMCIDVFKVARYPTPHENIVKKNMETCIRVFWEMCKSDGAPVTVNHVYEEQTPKD